MPVFCQRCERRCNFRVVFEPLDFLQQLQNTHTHTHKHTHTPAHPPTCTYTHTHTHTHTYTHTHTSLPSSPRPSPCLQVLLGRAPPAACIRGWVGGWVHARVCALPDRVPRTCRQMPARCRIFATLRHARAHASKEVVCVHMDVYYTFI